VRVSYVRTNALRTFAGCAVNLFLIVLINPSLSSLLKGKSSNISMLNKTDS
jgi:hypothetical protein